MTGGQQAAGHAMAYGTQTVANHMADVPPEGLIKLNKPFLTIRVLCSLHFFQKIGVATNSALAKKNQASRQNVGAFHRDANRHLLIGEAKNVGRPKADAFAAHHVHGVVHHTARFFGHMVFRNGRDHRRLFAKINGLGSKRANGIRHIDAACNSCQWLFHTLKP